MHKMIFINNRALNMISSCWVNTTSSYIVGRESNFYGVLVVLFLFHFPMKVARGPCS